MSKLTISLAGVDYDRTRAIFDGRVQVDGCEIIASPMTPEEAFHRAFKFQEFDVTELSMSSYMSQVSRDGSPYIGIPAFVSRMFRHSSIYIRTDKGIDKPQDLIGKIVGVPEYQMTAAMWIRGILQDEHGVKPADMRWRSGGLEEAGRKQNVSLHLPSDVELKFISPEETLNAQLDRGELDALVSAQAPSCFGTNDKIDRLFPHYRSDEEAYFSRTGMFPIMHLVGIRRSIVDRHPWLPVNVYLAYLEAKRICYRNLGQVGHLHTTLPWPVDEFAKARALMGEDYWRYGATANTAEIEAMTRYSFEQGLTARKLEPDDLFAASTFDLPKN